MLVFAYGMGARKLMEREGRLLKLLSSTMMLELAALLLLAPEYLNNLAIAFSLLGFAVVITLIVARLTGKKEQKV